MKTKYFCYGFVLLNLLGQAYGAAEHLNFNSYIERVLNASIDIVNARNSVNLRQQQIETSALFDKTQVFFGRENDTIPLINAHATSSNASWVVGVSQSFPWPGSFNSNKNYAITKVQIAKKELELKEAELKYAAMLAYTDMVLLNKKVKVNEELLASIQKFKELLQNKITPQQSWHNDLFEVQSEFYIGQAGLLQLKNEVKNAELRLLSNASLSGENFSFAYEIPREWFADRTIKTEIETNKNAELLNEIINSEKLSYEKLRASSYPSFSTQLSTMRNAEGMYMYNAMLGISIDFNQGKRIEVANNLEKRIVDNYSANFAQLNNVLASAKKALLNRIAQNKDNIIMLKNNLIPLAEQHDKLLLANFASGKSQISELINIKRTLNNYKTALLEAEYALVKEYINNEMLNMGLGVDSLYLPVSGLGLSSNMGAAAMGNAMLSKMPASSMAIGNKNFTKNESKQMNSKANTGGDTETESEAPPTSGGMGSMGGM